MKSVIIFAASIFKEERLYVLREFLQSFSENFKDCDFYIGVNYGSIPNLEDVIKEYNLNCEVSRVTNAKLYTESDASAYQEALKLLKNSGKRYDLYWFLHTKGSVNDRVNERKMYIDEYLLNRNKIEQMFESHPLLGSYGLRGNPIVGDGAISICYDVEIPLTHNEKTPYFSCTRNDWIYIETLYIIRKEPVDTFLDNTTDVFYSTKLNRWYFEQNFQWVTTRCGYFPYIIQKPSFTKSIDINEITKRWIEENNLPHLLPHLSL
jgi:hypothetical protein